MTRIISVAGWACLTASALVFAPPANSQSVPLVAQVAPSAQLVEAIAHHTWDAAMTFAGREYDACVVAHAANECLGLLAAQGDAQIAWNERYGELIEDVTANSEGLTLRTTRKLFEQVNTTKLRGFDAKIFASAFGNYGMALTEAGHPVQGEQHLRDALRYAIVGAQASPMREGYKDRSIRQALLRLARNLALQEDWEPAASMLEGVRSYIDTMKMMSDPDAEEPELEYLRIAALFPETYRNVDQSSPPLSASAGFEHKFFTSADLPISPPSEDFVRPARRAYIVYLVHAARYADALHQLAEDPQLIEMRSGGGLAGQEARVALGIALFETGRRSDAIDPLQIAVEGLTQILSPADDRLIDARVALGRALLAKSDLAGAATMFRAAADGAVIRVRDTDSTDAMVRAIRRYRPAFQGVVRALAASAGNRERQEAFTSAQWSSIGETAAALAKVSAQTSRGTGRVADLERDRQESARIVADLDREISRWVSAGSATGDADNALLAKFYKRDVDVVLGTLSTEDIARIDPAYDNLIRPRPLSVTQAAALLARDEALLFFLSDEGGTTTFVVTSDGLQQHRSRLTRADVEASVQQLRAELDQDLRLVRGDDTDYFDEVAANKIYMELIAPLEPALEGRVRWMTVTPGALSRLPLSLLVTATGNTPQDTRYLIDRAELATLPSVSSLFSIRCLLRRQAQPPAACGNTGAAPSTTPRAATATLFAAGAPALAGHPAEKRGDGDYSRLFDAELANPARLMELGYLPGTLQEITSVTAAFGQGRTTALTGSAATEHAIKGNPALRTARYVLFSTHGLLASETGMDGEPGLVFTPPAPGVQSPADDGVLTASEAAQLKLSADFVVLSACNTGSSDGRIDADGLSGLAQAFFYAGARSLLVSHWPLNDESGAAIVGTLFQRLTAQEGHGSAAFRAVVLNIRKDPKFATPALWAPFAFVGVTD